MKGALRLLWVELVVFFVFSILYKADFIFGDEHLFLSTVCQGIPCHMGMGIRSSGRFYPFQFWDINFVLLIPGLTPDHYALAFYIRNVIIFVVIMVFVFLLVSHLARKMDVNGFRGDLMVFFISLSVLTIPDFLRIFWHNIFAENRLALLFVVFAWCVVKARTGKKGWIIGAIASALLSIGYKETSFILCVVFPLTMLVFKWRERHDDEWRNFCRMCYVLLALGVAYIVFYFGYWARGVTHSYNVGRTLPLWGAVKFYMSIPLVAMSFALGVLRGVRVLFFKDRDSLVFDALLFSSLAIVCAYMAIGLVDRYYAVPSQCLLLIVSAYWLFWLFHHRGHWGVVIFLLWVVACWLNVGHVFRWWQIISDKRSRDMPFMRELAGDKSVSKIYYCTSEGALESYRKCVFTKFFRHAGGDLRTCVDGARFNGTLSTNEVLAYCVRDRVWQARGNRFKKLGSKVLKAPWFEAVYGPVKDTLAELGSDKTIYVGHFDDEDHFRSFYMDGEEGRWGNGDVHIVVPIPVVLRGKKLDVSLDANAIFVKGRPQNTLTVSVADKVVFLSSDKRNGPVCFTVSESLTNVEKIDFRVQTSYVVNPKREGISSDSRDFGVYFRSLRLTCAEKTN